MHLLETRGPLLLGGLEQAAGAAHVAEALGFEAWKAGVSVALARVGEAPMYIVCGLYVVGKSMVGARRKM
jgi:hypothetical protein